MPKAKIKVKFTDKSIKRKVGGSKPVLMWDTLTEGLALKINPGGKRSYIIMPRVLGAQEKITLGSTIKLSIAQARELAKTLFEQAERGISPKRTIKQAAQQAERAKKNSFRSVAEAYLVDPEKGGGGSLRSKPQLEKRLENDVYPEWGATPIREITEDDAIDLIDGVKKNKGPVAARATYSLISQVFKWAKRKKKIDVSPLANVDPPGVDSQRNHVLTDPEIARLWSGFEALGTPFAQIHKLLLLLGQRRNETAGMRRSEIHGDVWIIPGQRMKRLPKHKDVPHTVPLPALAIEIIDSVPKITREDGTVYDHIFSTDRRGDRAPSGWGRIKEKLDKHLVNTEAKRLRQKPDAEKHGILDWRLHDLRRTMRTGLSALKIRPDIAEMTIGHILTGVRSVYDRHQFDDEKRYALEAWSAHVQAIVSGKEKPDNVLPMSKRGR